MELILFLPANFLSPISTKELYRNHEGDIKDAVQVEEQDLGVITKCYCIAVGFISFPHKTRHNFIETQGLPSHMENERPRGLMAVQVANTVDTSS